ncbi:hypothetical protein SLEP1_g57075 [Rubroshorea leprosula]|uniref:P-type H(+)-exporting transporter n=1 Tax=Rubroshorea leprosula TaxID=152421 RepID=A0AAV5MLQ9_9ROSI|nr:hypothetical protein SLEP1_g57075 [Rubroshorea leprosula]
MADDRAISLEEIKTQSVDLERMPVEEVLEQLKCTRAGLTSDEGARRLQVFGPNKLEEKKESKILKLLGLMWNPLSWVMEAAAIMAIVMANGGGRPPNWQEFVGIVVLLLINSTISFIEENKAGNAAAALMADLAPKTKVLRDGQWNEQDAAILVPGDIITIKLGDIIPADARLLEGDPLKIDQSALTGESLPVTKSPSDEVFSGSICKQGEIEAVVIATGVHSFLGKAEHLVDSTNQVGHFQKVLTAIGNFCICLIFIGLFIEAVVMYGLQHRNYRDGIDNLLVLLIGGTPTAMPTVLSATMSIGSQRLSQQGAITKRRTAIEEMARMDVLCSDKTGTLTLNKLTVERNMIEVFVEGIEMDQVILHAARASRTENQDAIDAAIVGMLADPKEARAGIREVHFYYGNTSCVLCMLLFLQVLSICVRATSHLYIYKRTALTYIDSNGNWHRASKGAPEQILDLCNSKRDVRRKVHAVVDQFAERVLQSLAVAIQELPEKTKDSSGEPWQLIGLLPLFDPPRHDSAETIRMAQDLGVNVKMITGDQLAIAKETGRRLGMGTDMYSSSSLFFEDKDALLAAFFTKNEFIEMAAGFAGVLPEHKYEIVKRLQERKHICGMTGDNDAPALKKADIGIAVANASDAARSASDIVLTEPGLSVIISAFTFVGILLFIVSWSKLKCSNHRSFLLNLQIYAVSATIHIVFSFLIIALVWKFDFAPFMVLIIAILNDGTIMTIPRDRVKLSPQPESWKLREIFTTGIVLGGYLAVMTVLFFWAMRNTNFFLDIFYVIPLNPWHSPYTDQKIMAALYLQVSIVSQGLIFVTRSPSFSYVERPGLLLVIAFIVAQLVATLIAVYANWDFAKIKGIGWTWAGVIWLYSLVTYILLDLLKFAIQYLLGSNVRDTLLQDKTTFTTKNHFSEEDSYRELSEIAGEAKHQAEVIRPRRLTLKGHVESDVKLKGLDIGTAAFDASTRENFLHEWNKEKPVRYTAQQLDDFTRNYSKRLGSGACGDVYEGQFPNGVKIAVKLLKEKYEGAAKKQFMAEIGTIGRTNHINLVRLYGFCYDGNTSALVYEFMENGSLDNYLFGKKEMIEWQKLHIIAVGTAKGVAYLHQDCQQRIIHYDIKPANILLDANFLPKVADFGLAKLCNRDSTHDSVTGFKGTLGYSAPELFLRNHPKTYKCDVYSFGMLLFEIVGRRKNTVSTSSEIVDWFPKVVLDKYQKGELAELIKSYGIKKEDMEKAERMSLVALWCVQDSLGARPPMSAVVKMLEGGVEIMPPPKPTHLLFSSLGKTAVKPPNAATDSSFSSSEESNSNWYKETTAIMAKYEIEVASS